MIMSTTYFLSDISNLCYANHIRADALTIYRKDIKLYAQFVSNFIYIDFFFQKQNCKQCEYER